MTNFKICIDHTVDQLTIVDRQGHPGCVFCKIEELRALVLEACQVARACEPSEEYFEDIKNIEYRSQK